MRVTTHNGRAGKHGTYSPKHNDRKFDPKNAEHINSEKSSNNFYWHCYKKKHPQMSFEDAEKKFYSYYFNDSLNAQNERYRKNGHKERMKTMDEYRTAKQTCPEETIFQIGNTDETVDYKLLNKVLIEQLKWEEKQFKNVKILNIALHTDEEGAPHVHVRKVWTAKGKDGLIVSQTKALEEMGIERPDLNKKKSRYNNPKMTYTQICRDHFVELCEQKGLTIEKTPDATSKKGLDLDTFKANKEREKAEKFKQQQKAAETARDKALKDKEDAEQETSDLKATNKNLKAENKELQEDNENLCSDYNDLLKDYDDLVRREKEVQEKEEEINRKSQNMKSFIDSKVKEQLDQQVEKVLKPVALTGEAERIQKYMKTKKFDNGKTLYDYYEEDLRYEVNQNLKQYKSQQKQQQKTNNDYFQEYQQSQDTKDYDDFLTNDEYWQNFGDYDDIIKNDEYWQNLEDYDNFQF